LNPAEFSEIAKLLSTPSQIVVTSHYNPDGDAVGSAMALYHILSKSGQNVNVVIPNDFPDFLKWIPGSKDAVIFELEQRRAEDLLKSAQVVFCLDYNAPSRVDIMEKALIASTAIKILIDHHPNPDEEAFDYLYSKVSASSTAELVYQFAEAVGLKKYINTDAAKGLYAGIVTDTGSFSFSCNSPATYRIMAEIMELGVDAVKLHQLIYDNFSESRIRLLGNALGEKMVVLPEFHTAYIPLSNSDLESFNYKVGDTEGIVNYPLSIKEINLAILMTERKSLIRLSFRSKGDFPANQIAREYFEGGGHKNAAGGNSELSMEDTIQRLREILPLFSEQLDFQIQ
jgi:phosphoesterase RecJ-like protein